MDHKEYCNVKLLTKLVVEILSNFAPEEKAMNKIRGIKYLIQYLLSR